MRRFCCCLWGIAVLGACSSVRDAVGQRAENGADAPPTAVADVSDTAGVTNGAGMVSGERGTTSAPHSSDAAASASLSSASAGSDLDSPTAEADKCPSLGVVLPLGELGETTAKVSVWSDDGAMLQEVAAEVLWTPGEPRDPNTPWPEALPEAEWDRSVTPLASCTIWLRAFSTDCYDTTSSNLVIDPAGERRIVFNNLSDPTSGFNSPPRCDFEPGCRYPFELGFIDGYYVVPEGRDTRVVICGMKCDEHRVAAFTLGPRVAPCNAD